jgi:hypothetical protein
MMSQLIDKVLDGVPLLYALAPAQTELGQGEPRDETQGTPFNITVVVNGISMGAVAWWTGDDLYIRSDELGTIQLVNPYVSSISYEGLESDNKSAEILMSHTWSESWD